MKKSHGKVIISENVIKQITKETLKDIKEFIDINKATKNDFFKKKQVEEIEIEMTDTQCVIDLNIALEYGSDLIEVASKIQREVLEKVEKLTKIEVKEINVVISGLYKKNMKEGKKDV